MTINKKASLIASAFVSYLKKSGNYNLLDKIIAELAATNKDIKADVVVTTPTSLNDKQKQSAQNLVKKIVGIEKKITFKVNPDILDGIQIKYLDNVWDYSLASFLDK